jgi:hypothetical protein
LLYNPKCTGISRHIEMQDLPPVVADDEKAVQNTKRERWDGEEVHRRNGPSDYDGRPIPSRPTSRGNVGATQSWQEL